MAEQPDWLKLPSDLLEPMARRTSDAVMGVATFCSGSTAALPNLNAVRDSSAASEITHLGYEHTPDHEEPNLNTVPDGGAASEIMHLGYEHAPDHVDPNLNAVHDGSATSEVAHLGYELAPDHEEAPTDGLSDLEAAADNHLEDEESETEVEDGLSDLEAAADNHLEDEESETEVEDGLSDLEAAADNHLEDEESETEVEEKKYSKKEMLKRDADRKKQYMAYALQKYNNDVDLAEEKRFVFDESIDEVFIIEGNRNFYEHFNFTAKQAGSTVLFFAEVIPDEGELCDVLCCKPLDSDDNGHCFGCKNQGSVDLRHPAGESLYVGGHVDCEFPFMWDSISEDDSD